MTNMVEGCASIAEINSISFPAIEAIRGLPSVGGTPAEFYAAVQGVNIGMQALKRAGRPGLPVLNLISTAATAQTAIAASAPKIKTTIISSTSVKPFLRFISSSFLIKNTLINYSLN